MSFKQKMRNELLFPAVNSGETSSRVLAKVKKVDESRNTCQIEYFDKKGKRRIDSNVPVRVSSYSVIDWFPTKGDVVVIEVFGRDAIITGEPETISGVNNRSKNTIESDVYSDNMSCNTEGGYVF